MRKLQTGLSGIVVSLILVSAWFVVHCAQTSPTKRSKNMDLVANDIATLRAAYQRAPHEILQASWSFSWWHRGGEPGPDWLSDKVELTSTNGNTSGRYIRARNAQVPPFKSHADEFTGDVPAALAERLWRAVFATQLYEKVFPSEGQTELADARKHTFECAVGSLRLSKTLYEPTKEELGELGQAIEAVAAHLQDRGIRKDITSR